MKINIQLFLASNRTLKLVNYNSSKATSLNINIPSQTDMIEIYRKLIEILQRTEKKLTALTLLLMLFVAFFETIGVASIMPFMAVLANPDIVHSNKYLSLTYEALGFSSTEGFLIFLGSLFLVIIVGSIAFRAFSFWIILRFCAGRNYSWSRRLANHYLDRPYEWFLDKHSGNLTASVLDEVGRAVYSALLPAMQFISHALIALFLFILLIITDPVLAFSVMFALGFSYAVIYLLVKKPLEKLGHEILTANRMRFKTSQEMFGGIKEIKISGLEKHFLDRFCKPSLRSIHKQVTVQVISQLPSFAMQALIFGGIMAVLLYFMATRDSVGDALPIFALYALAGYRLMPALQAMYRSISEMKASTAVLDRVHEQITSLNIVSEPNPYDCTDVSNDKLPRIQNSLQLENIFYRYPESTQWALNSVTLTIPALSTIGLVGPSGAGKTTLVDVILGLLEPEKGEILIDNTPLTPSLRKVWQRKIGYVPQQIFLADDTVSGNIAFGIPSEDIDLRRVEQAARAANLDEFITTQLPQAYDTIVGERGVRLSGGQRQRIGIARALYHDPEILVLDEATSALDNLTEQAVMEAVRSLNKKKTIILIAHRLSTVRECDEIFYLEAGNILTHGTYEDLVRTSSEFRKLTGDSE